MKIHNIIEAINYADPDPKPEQSVVDKFAGVADSQRSYYIMKWAEEKGMKTDDAMFKAGYIKDGYIGAGAWNWRYVGMGESVQEKTNPMIMNRDGKEIELTKSGDSMKPKFHLKINGEDHGTFDSEKAAMQHSARLKEDIKVGDMVKSKGGVKGTVTKVDKDRGRVDVKPSKPITKKREYFNNFKIDDVERIKEAEQEMIGEPDSYYDAEERIEAHDQLQDILQGNFMDDYIKDGVCPECAGSGYMDGEETFTNDDGEEEESSECMGFGNYGCDEGEMTYNNDTVTWKTIADHDYNQEIKAERKSKPQPSEEQIMKILPRLHDDYVKSGRYNAFELPSILRQMYPELGKREAAGYTAEFFKTFEESTQPIEEDSGEALVAKMLAKALGDENRWTEMSAIELYAELESTNPEVADMISKVAKMLYDVKLSERAYKDVGVADTVKDQRGKEFNFDKGSKKFKSQDGEEADITTKLGKDLMRMRKNQMKKTTPSYKTKKNQGIMASIEEAYGDAHEITLEDNEDFNDVFGVLGYSLCEQDTFEAEYQGRKVKLNKPMQGDTKKFKVYVKDPKTGNVKKVNFGHGGSSAKRKTMRIRKSNPKARKSFRARHNCDNPGPKTKARYWSCRKW